MYCSTLHSLRTLKSRVHLYLRDRWSDHLRVGLVLTVSLIVIRPDQLFVHRTSVSRPKGGKSKSRGSGNFDVSVRDVMDSGHLDRSICAGLLEQHPLTISPVIV
jgi:hypothetical protein